MSIQKTTVLFLMSLFMLVCSSISYAEIAGRVQFVNGEVQVTSLAGQVKRIHKGDAVNEGDTIASAQAASAQIRMRDGGMLAVRADTQFKIDGYHFNGLQDGSEHSFFSLFKGGFRAITGLIGKLNKANYRIETPATTIGIRGTDHEVFVVLANTPMAKLVPVGTYDRVNVGETSMSNAAGTIFVLPNQMGFAAAPDRMPEIRPIEQNLYAAQANAGGSPSVVQLRPSVVDSTLTTMDVNVPITLPETTVIPLKPITAITGTPVPVGGPVQTAPGPNNPVSIITF